MEPKLMENVQVKGIVDFGIDTNTLVDLLKKYGNDVIETITSAIQHGLSKEFILDILNRFGPLILNLLVSILSKKTLGVAEDQNVSESEIVDSALKELFLNKLLPRMLEKRGEEISDAIIEVLIKYLKSL